MNGVHDAFRNLLVGISLALVGYLVYGGFIIGGDLAVIFVLTLSALVALKRWKRPDGQTDPNSALYRMLTVIAVVVAVLSLSTASFLRKYVPEQLDSGIVRVLITPPPPTGVTVTPLPRATSPVISGVVTPGTGSYVAAGTTLTVDVAPAARVLESVMGDIDYSVRFVPALLIACFLAVTLLAVVKIAAPMRRALELQPVTPAAPPAPPTPPQPAAAATTAKTEAKAPPHPEP